MANKIHWILIILSVLYGFFVTLFASKLYFGAIQRSLQQKKINPLLQVFFPLISALLLFLPGLLHIIYWTISFGSSIITVAVLLIRLKIHTKQKDAKQ
ncbi:MAG: hypothetical protein PHI40_03090 [Caldisericia bacterium]|nr:hypothetical protein [Caldisericia bacterium]MDD4614378.1 hypothetical protein [Caldisericia bacterium]